MSPSLLKRASLPVPPAEAFTWHERPNAFRRLNAPWMNVELLRGGENLHDGTELVLRIHRGPLRLRWIARMHGYNPPHAFSDQQLSGPFAEWNHTHRFLPSEDGAGTILEDDVAYRLPLASLGGAVAGGLVHHELERFFDYRHRVLANDLLLHKTYGLPPQRILITGSSGLIGTALTYFLTTGGHEVLRLVRSRQNGVDERQVLWNPQKGVENPAELEGLDAVIHLAGENLASGRWTAERKRRIRDSRVVGTRVLCEALARLQRKPRVLLSASAVGIYGNRSDEILTEASAPGSTEEFLARVCAEWEAAAQPARDAGIHVVHPRFGIVLSPAGGALKSMLPLFKAMLGGRLGRGEQWMSWVALDDVLGALLHLLAQPDAEGPVNVTAPQPVTNKEFTHTLARVLGRLPGPPAPALALKAALGELAEEGLLSSARVHPERLRATGYRFLFPDLEHALLHQLGRAREATLDSRAPGPAREADA